MKILDFIEKTKLADRSESEDVYKRQIAGRVNRQYFYERLYGAGKEKE